MPFDDTTLEFSRFLARLHADLRQEEVAGRLHEDVFATENFRHDRRLSVKRKDSYDKALRTPSIAPDWQQQSNDWAGSHTTAYFYPRVAGSDNDLELQGIPECFVPGYNPHLCDWDEQVTGKWLFRIESLWFLQQHNGLFPPTYTEDDFRTEFESLGNSDQRKRLSSDHLFVQFFKRWNDRRDRRPMFVGFHEDIGDIVPKLGEPIPAVDWPNRLRDLCGLCHYPAIPNFPSVVVLMFFDGATLQGRMPRPIPYFVAPTVVDDVKFNPAYMPSSDAHNPSWCGRVLNLDPLAAPYRSIREVFVPQFNYDLADHIYIGQINALRPDASHLKLARERHCQHYGS